MTKRDHDAASAPPADDADGPRSRGSVTGWALWTLPGHVLAYVLAVDVAAVVLGVPVGALPRPTAVDLPLALLLAAGSMVHLEAARRIEQIRHLDSTDSGQPYIDAKSMWSFAGLILLEPGPALALVVFTLAWWWLRVSRRPPPYRWAYSCATIVIGSCAALAVLDLAGPDALDRIAEGPRVAIVLVAAALVRWTVNHGLVVAVLRLTQPRSTWRRRLGSATDNLIGMGALALGIALAVLVHATPWLVPVLLLPVLAMHRGFLLGHFARAARTDPKTGLATLGHWREHATRELARVRRRGGGLGVLMIDLDEFKSVNDRLGHVTGDLVLRAAADAVRAEIRTEDAVGRFGGEEFVALLVDVTPQQLVGAAERVRRRVAECDGVPGLPGHEVAELTISVGAAAYPTAADDLDGLIAAADGVLLRAKRDGRNCVRVAEPGG